MLEQASFTRAVAMHHGLPRALPFILPGFVALEEAGSRTVSFVAPDGISLVLAMKGQRFP
jgi:hypothetical protein